MDELSLFTVTSPSLHFKQTGSLLQYLLTSSSFNSIRRAPLLFTIDEPYTALQTDGLLLQFLLTSSPLNTDGRALTIHSDEPLTALQTDGLLLQFLLTSSPSTQTDELLLFTVTSPSLHFKQTGSSYNSY